MKELREKKIPFTIRRYLPDGRWVGLARGGALWGPSSVGAASRPCGILVHRQCRVALWRKGKADVPFCHSHYEQSHHLMLHHLHHSCNQPMQRPVVGASVSRPVHSAAVLSFAHCGAAPLRKKHHACIGLGMRMCQVAFGVTWSGQPPTSYCRHIHCADYRQRPGSCASITMVATVILTPHVLWCHRSYEDWSLKELIITEG
jgi:hypothetical protein